MLPTPNPVQGESLADLQNAVSEDAAKLNQVSSELVAASRVSPEDLAVVANNFAAVYGKCINHSMQLAGATKVRAYLCIVCFIMQYACLVYGMLVALPLSYPSTPQASNLWSLDLRI